MDQVLELLNLDMSEFLKIVSSIVTVIFIVIIFKILNEHKKALNSIDDKYKNLINSFKKDKESANENGEILNIENKNISQIIESFKKSAKIGTENINTEVIIQRALGYDLIENEKKIKLLPSISIACGLLGTFIGLSLTIFATRGILDLSMSDYQNFASEMGAPLSSMGTAFITSIFGVLCSISLNKKNIQLEKLKEEFYDLIEDYLDNTIYALYAKNFTSQFERFTNTVSGEMLNLAEQMRVLFKEGVEELVGKINKNTINLTDMVIAMTDSTNDLNRLSKSLNKSVENFRKPVEAFKISMDDFINTSESTSQSMRDSVNKFGVNVVNLEDKLSQMNNILDINKTKMENIAISIRDSSEIMKKSYNNAEETMNNISKKQINSIEEFGKQLEDFKNTSEKLSKSLNEFTKGFKDTQELTAENIANIIKDKLLETKGEIIENINESVQDVKKSVCELNKKSDRVSKQTKESTDLFEKINNQLKDDKVQDDIVKRAISEKVANELNDNIDQINKRLNDYMQYTQQKINESLNKLDKSIEKTKTNLDYSVNDLNESANYIKKETDKINKIADSVNKIIENNINDEQNK